MMSSGGDEPPRKDVTTGGSSSSGGGIPSANPEWRFNQTLRNVQGLLKGRSFPGKVLLTRKSEPPNVHASRAHTQEMERSYSQNDPGNEHTGSSFEAEVRSYGRTANNANLQKTNISLSTTSSVPSGAQGSVSGARATDSARVAKFTKELSRQAVILAENRDMHRLIQIEGREFWLERDLSMLNVSLNIMTFLTLRGQVMRSTCIARSLWTARERYLMSLSSSMLKFRNPWNAFFIHGLFITPQVDMFKEYMIFVTPFLIVFLSEHLNGSMESWSISDLSPQIISNIEADCYWCLSKLLDGMQDHYTFAQPGIQRLVFRLRELVRRIDEPVSRHMEEQGLEFLQFAFRWFNCLLIREWSDKLQKFDFQEMVMFLQHLPTEDWTHHELEMVLSRAFMWHTMFSSSTSHLAS